MKVWHKVALGAGVALATGGVVYWALKRDAEETDNTLVSEETTRRDQEKKEKIAREEKKGPEAQLKIDPLIIMNEVMVDSMEYLLKFSEVCAQWAEKEPVDNDSFYDQLFEQAQALVLLSEKAVCRRRNIQVEDYYKEIEMREEAGDTEILAKSEEMEDVLNQIIYGHQPQLHLIFPEQLTERITLLLFKWILMSHIYLHHLEVQSYLEQHGNITHAEMKKLLKNLHGEKIKRRDILIHRYDVPILPNQNCKYVLQSAFYTYRTNDPIFELEVNRLLQLYSVLESKVDGRVRLEEMERDPLFMTEEEFEDFYSELYSKYGEFQLSPSRDSGTYSSIHLDKFPKFSDTDSNDTFNSAEKRFVDFSRNLLKKKISYDNINVTDPKYSINNALNFGSLSQFAQGALPSEGLEKSIPIYPENSEQQSGQLQYAPQQG